MAEKKVKKTASKAKVSNRKKVITLDVLEKMGVNILPEDYLNASEREILTRIKDKEIRTWRMSIEEFLEKNKDKEIYIYPFSEKEIYWEFKGEKYIRAFLK